MTTPLTPDLRKNLYDMVIPQVDKLSSTVAAIAKIDKCYNTMAKMAAQLTEGVYPSDQMELVKAATFSTRQVTIHGLRGDELEWGIRVTLRHPRRFPRATGGVSSIVKVSAGHKIKQAHDAFKATEAEHRLTRGMARDLLRGLIEECSTLEEVVEAWPAAAAVELPPSLSDTKDKVRELLNG